MDNYKWCTPICNLYTPLSTHTHTHTGEALHECKGIVAVLSKGYSSSKYCVKELTHADASGKEIFPIMYEKVDLDQISQAVNFITKTTQYVDFENDDEYSQSLDKLVKGMKEVGLGNNNIIILKKSKLLFWLCVLQEVVMRQMHQ